jgi:hypothetical protein
MKPASTTEIFLRRQGRRSRGTLLAWSAAVAACAYAWDGAAELGWIKANAAWALVPVAGAAYLLVRWVRRVWRLNERAVAREMDTHWELGARLESAVELSGSDSAVAVAQRVDTAQLLVSKKPTGTLAWLSGIAGVIVAVGVVSVEEVALYQRAHRPPPVMQPQAVIAQAAPVAPNAPPPPPPEPLRA